jgi:hypothetical protein
MVERTAQEARTANEAAMGAQLGAVYSELWQEVAWVHHRWDQYVALYGTSPKRVDLLNQAAPAMFRVVQDTLFEAVLLHVARLTDPSKAVLSLQRLVKLSAKTPVASEVRRLADIAIKESEFARDWRNRKLAHRSLSLALGEKVQGLAPASRESVKSALGAFSDVLNAIARHYLNSTTAFNLGLGGDPALQLLYVIRDGVRREEERRARWDRGEFLDEDINDDGL